MTDLVTLRPSLPARVRPDVLDDDAAPVARSGWAIIAVFFGLLGSWSLMAPLNGAVVADGVVKVEGNRKSIQHLDGGIVKAIRVQEGDRVKSGQVLLLLDDTQTHAEVEVLSQQFAVLRAMQVRLSAEIAHAPRLERPADLASVPGGPNFDGIWEGQVNEFEIRRTGLAGERKIIAGRIAQLSAEIDGHEAQRAAAASQLVSMQDEIVNLRALQQQGLVAKPRLLQLERAAADVEGRAGEIGGRLARAKQEIADEEQKAAQLDVNRVSEAADRLRDVQAKLSEVVPRLANARAVLGRMSVRSPYSGQIVGLNVFAVGAVIAAGEKLLDVVPDQQSLVVEAQIGVTDISDVRPNMRAEVRLTAYPQRTTPVVHGDVINVSADRLIDDRSGRPFYVALVRVDANELAALPKVQLTPGMPATVMIQTVERSAFDYLVGPLLSSFDRSFRQK